MALEDAINNLAAAINRFADLQGAAPVDRTIEAHKAVKDTPGEGPKEVKKQKESPTHESSNGSSKTQSETDVASTETKTESSDTSTTQASSVEPENISETFFAKANELIQLDVEKAKIVLTELGYPKFKLVPANLHAKGLKLVEAQLND